MLHSITGPTAVNLVHL